MRKSLLLLVLLVSLCATNLAQSIPVVGPTSSASKFQPYPASPANCNPGDVYFDSALANFYFCKSLGSWTALLEGTVTSFSSGNLSPLFSTNVATASSTPALSFSLSNATAYQVFGNCTNTTGIPGYCGLVAAMIPNLSGTYQPLLTYPVTGPASPTPGYLTKWGPSGDTLADGLGLSTLTNTDLCTYLTASGLNCTTVAPSGAIVGTTDTQSLSAKTLEAPIIQSYVIASLPTPTTYMLAWASDGASTTDCTTGLGTTKVLCYYNGTAWTAVSSGGAVSSVANSDATLTISPTTGSVVASLNLGHANTWTANQVFGENKIGIGMTPVTSGGTVLPLNSNSGIGNLTDYYLSGTRYAQAGLMVSGYVMASGNTGDYFVSNQGDNIFFSVNNITAQFALNGATNNLVAANTTSYNFSSTSDALGAANSGISSSSANFIKSNNGSTGGGGYNFPAISAPSSPNTGDTWNNSTQKALTSFLNAVTQTLDGTLFTSTANATVANTTTETSIVGTGVGTLTIPANFCVAGKTLTFRNQGIIANTATPTIEFKVYLGATAVLDSTAFTTATITGTEGYDLEGTITYRTCGATGTIAAQGKLTYGTGITGAVGVSLVNASTVTVDTTAAQAFYTKVTWGTASASNTITGTNAYLSVKN